MAPAHILMALRDAKDGSIPEGTLAPAHPRHAAEPPALGEGTHISAESGIEFRNQDSVTFDLKNLNDCRFLFGQNGDEVFANAHNQAAKVSECIVTADTKTNTLYISPK